MGGSLGPGHIVGLFAAAGLLGAGLWVLWLARARADDDRRVELPGLGKVGNPTCLTVGVCTFLCAYHAAAYSLAPVVVLVSVPIDRWWVLAGVVLVAVGGAIGAELLERRHG